MPSIRLSILANRGLAGIVSPRSDGAGSALPSGSGLLGVADAAGLADDGDLDLTGVGHLILNAASNLLGERRDGAIIGVLCPDDDAQLAPCLDGVGLDDAGVRGGQRLEVVETLDVGLDDLTAGTGTGAADGVTDLYDGGDEALHLDLVVVGTDGVADVGLLLVLLTELHPEEGVGQLGLVVGHLTYIMQEPSALGVLGVESQLGGHDGTEVGRLAGVL